MTQPDDVDIDGLFDALEGIDALRTVFPRRGGRTMTTLYESPTHRQDDIDCVVQGLGAIVDLQCGFPDGSLDDGAGQWTTAVLQEIRDGLKKLTEATCAVLFDGAETLWEYAKARGLADDIAAMSVRDFPNHYWDENTHVAQLIEEWKRTK
jgi:hypothetical protein